MEVCACVGVVLVSRGVGFVVDWSVPMFVDFCAELLRDLVVARVAQPSCETSGAVVAEDVYLFEAGVAKLGDVLAVLVHGE